MVYMLLLTLLLSVADFFLMKNYLKVAEGKKLYALYAVKVIINALAFVLLYFKYPQKIYGYLMICFISLIGLISIEDALTLKIDKILSLLSLLLGLIVSFFVPGGVFWKIIIFSAIIALVMFLFSLKSKDSVGKGDIICVSASSLCFVFNNVFSLMIYTLFSCLIFGIIQLLFKKGSAKQGIPFAPFIVFGLLLTILLA